MAGTRKDHIWKWEESAAAWDKHESDELAKVIADEKARVFTNEFALTHKRVEALNNLAAKLLKSVDHDSRSGDR